MIKRIAYEYEYQGGAYRMTGKRADVKKASRDAAEAFFERMLPQAQVHAKTIGANLDSVMAMPVDYFDVS